MLPLPAGHPRDTSYGLDITNNGVIIGRGWDGGPDYSDYSWWRSRGREGAVSNQVANGARAIPTNIDDRGRLVGFVPRGEDDPPGPITKWRNVHYQPENIPDQVGLEQDQCAALI